MRYQGGKSRIAKCIGGVIEDDVYGRKIKNCQTDSRTSWGGKTFVSLFCGTCSVESKVAPFF